MEDGLKEQCEHMRKVLVDAGYDVVDVLPTDHGGQVWAVARIKTGVTFDPDFKPTRNKA